MFYAEAEVLSNANLPPRSNFAVFFGFKSKTNSAHSRFQTDSRAPADLNVVWGGIMMGFNLQALASK